MIRNPGRKQKTYWSSKMRRVDPEPQGIDFFFFGEPILVLGLQLRYPARLQVRNGNFKP
jgi:hypothetical protein